MASFLPRIAWYLKLLQFSSSFLMMLLGDKLGKTKRFILLFLRSAALKKQITEWFKTIGFEVRPGFESRLLY